MRRYLREDEAKRYCPREPRACKLDPFNQFLRERVDQAGPRWIPATVLLREISERGYDGGLTQVKQWLAPLKKIEPQPVVRFETPPGKQMQADFTTVRRGRDPLIALVTTMGYSRATFVKFAAGEDASILCAGLREASDYFGGVPEHVRFDNMKAVVIERDAYGEGKHRWNTELNGLAEEGGFAAKLCQPYRAQTKGKVERFNAYLKRSFVVPLAATVEAGGLKLDVSTANRHVRRRLDESSNVRVHAATKVVPAVRLREERTVRPGSPNASRCRPRACNIRCRSMTSCWR